MEIWPVTISLSDQAPSNREENEIANLRWIEALIWLNFHVRFTSCYAPRLLLFIPSSPSAILLPPSNDIIFIVYRLYRDLSAAFQIHFV